MDVITYKSAISACEESRVFLFVKSGRSGASASLPPTSAVKGNHGDAVKEGGEVSERNSGDVSEPCLDSNDVNFLVMI